MKTVLLRILKVIAYAGAAVVILLAVLVGMFRLFLPRLPEYQDEIKAWASTAIGMQVEFAGMDARWGLQGPELTFYDAELIRADTGIRAIAASEVGVGVSLQSLLAERILVVDTLRVRDSNIEIREMEDGSWRIQGNSPEALLALRGQRSAMLDSIEIIGENLALQVLRADDPSPTTFLVPRMSLESDSQRMAIDVSARLPAAMGRNLSLSATRVNAEEGQIEPWNVLVEARQVDLAGVAEMYRDEAYQVSAGTGDVDVSLSVLEGALQSVSAQVALEGVQLGNGPGFDVSGRLAFNSEEDGWLAAADELRMRTPQGEWPLSSLRAEAGVDDEGRISVIDLRASYLQLSDWTLVAEWLSEEQRSRLQSLAPDGILHNLVSTLEDIDEKPESYTVTADLERVGFAGTDEVPGFRGFSGTLRADQDGGLLEIDAWNVAVDLSRWVTAPVVADTIDGTVTWRRSGDRLTVLSHNIGLKTAVLDSQNSLEVIVAAGESPVVDFSSNWRINDVAEAKRFIPEQVMPDKLYQWFQSALVSGRIPAGTARLNGALEDFPFAGDEEGSLLLEARVEGLTLKYLPTFPATEVTEMDVVLDNLHLYTRRNRSVTLGSVANNARVDIRDLLDPVLTIDARANGTLESLHAFAANSPISKIFGGQLDRVSVDGDASLALDLSIPIRNWRTFELLASIQSNNGTMAFTGLGAELTELSGTVNIERDHINSEGLGGVFLGETVAIDLQDASPDMPGYRIFANASGTATGTALVEELGLPLEGRLTGQTDYGVQIRFPRAGQESPQPLSIQVESGLDGLAVDLPAPFDKPASETRQVTGELVFAGGGASIKSRGRIDGELSWIIDFAKQAEEWDFDRGVLSLGAGPAEEAEVRGLHVRGNAEAIDVAEWLSLSRGDGKALGAGERVRSVDLAVDTLYFLGQRLTGHRVRVDRSARDWLVQLDGTEVQGSMFIPYDFGPSSTLVLDMERLIFPGDGEVDDPGQAPQRQIDPRQLPAISLKAGVFGLGERRFGAVEAELAHDGQGLVSEKLEARGETFNIDGTARWLADAVDSQGSRTYLAATLTSSDVEDTLAQLGYQPGILGDDMRISIDIDWSGGPRADFIDSLDGQVAVSLGTGQLNEVEPGAGRVFGLMSIVALPRRLSLDFRDVFQKGFGFDEISGTFNLEDGVASTCDLSLQGPAADIGILGQANLVAGNYSQTAVVSPNVGNTLPVLGGIAAGPQVAAAMFLFTQIFKKPLKDIGQVYYSVAGSWEDPVVESTDAESFAASGEAAGCLADAG